jgi:hypothetical protein
MKSKYQWPSLALSEKEMRTLYRDKFKTQTPINQLIKKAILQMVKEEK